MDAGATRGRSRATLRALVPWLIAAAALAYMFTTIPLDEVGEALAAAPAPWVVAVAFGAVLGLWLADALAMTVAFRAALPDHAVGYGDALRMRGASYLLALVNYGAGQGGIVYFLRRHHGVPVAQGAGAVLLAAGVFILVVTLAVGAGLLAGAVPDHPQLRYAALVVPIGLAAYLLLVRWRPPLLARRALLAPLFDAGVSGTLRVGGARAIHLAVMLATHIAAMRLFGIEVPLAAAIAQLPVVFLVGALPISPAGIGTTQAAAVTLFARYAPGGSDEAQAAVVLAYSLSLQALSAMLTAVLGLVCLRLSSRRGDLDTAAAEP